MAAVGASPREAIFAMRAAHQRQQEHGQQQDAHPAANRSPLETPPTSQLPHQKIPKAAQERYFTPDEVAEHNSPDDCWLSWLGLVYDLTKLVEEHRGSTLLLPILKNAGKDISHWFDRKTGDVKVHVNPLTGCVVPYTPEGRFLHVPPTIPRTDWRSASDPSTPWWLDKEEYCIGNLSSKTRKIRIINTLTRDEHVLQVCSEDKLAAIQDRYMNLNAHAKGYMWKRLGTLLDMSLSLEENGVRDESAYFERLGIDEDQWLPAIHLYFSDDLTIA
ncbi:cytochrome b5-like heme/steroid binding domain-containing protein [Entophlyctis helioformis]|nr:cytochrome b5-like heme/steroid binding domain-containing protein [Entophlyctis helioformis]